MARASVVNALLAASVLSLVAAGCTAPSGRGGSEPAPPSSSPPATSPPASAALDVAVYGPDGSLEAYDELAEAFMEENRHVTVEVRRFDDAVEVMEAVEGDMPPDVFLMDREHLPQLVVDGAVRPLNDLLEAREVDFGGGYQRSGLTAFAADASLQCMPHDVSPLVVYYNEDLVRLDRIALEDEPPPSARDGWTWEAFARAARRASRGPADGLYLGPRLSSLAPFVWSAGGEVVDDPQAPTTLTLSEGDARAALEEVLALVRDPEVTPSRAELRKQDAVTRFARGRLAMILGTRALTPRLRQAEGLDFDVMPLPSLGLQRTIADMTGYCIAADTEELDAAADFVAFAVGQEGATITTRPGYVVPSNLAVAHSPAFLQRSEQPEQSFIFNEGVRRTQSLPFSPAWPELTERVEPALARLFYASVIDLEELLAEIDALSREVLAPAAE